MKKKQWNALTYPIFSVSHPNNTSTYLFSQFKMFFIMFLHVIHNYENLWILRWNIPCFTLPMQIKQPSLHQKWEGRRVLKIENCVPLNRSQISFFWFAQFLSLIFLGPPHTKDFSFHSRHLFPRKINWNSSGFEAKWLFKDHFLQGHSGV